MAITFSEARSASNINNGNTFPFTISAGIGDLVGMWGWNQAGAGQTVTISDSVNTGNYTNVTPQGSDGTRQLIVAYKVCNASGTPTITFALSNTLTGVNIWHYSGFSGVATVLSSTDYTNNLHTGSQTTAVSGTSFNTSQPAELVLAFLADLNGQTWGTAPSGWNLRTGSISGQNALYDQTVSTQGTATAITGTLAVADFWMVTQLGIYDMASAPPGIPLLGQILM